MIQLINTTPPVEEAVQPPDPIETTAEAGGESAVLGDQVVDRGQETTGGSGPFDLAGEGSGGSGGLGVGPVFMG